MMIKICIFVLATVFAVNAAPVISLLGTNVDVNYGQAAVNALTEAYNLSPDSHEETVRMESFSQFFGKVYETSGGWNVALDYSTLYLPNKPQYVTLKVVEDGATEKQAKIVKIFNNEGT